MASAIQLVATGLSLRSQRKARKAGKKAEQIQGKRAALENARARRQQVAQARRLRAQTIAQGQAAGISGGSQVAGATGALETQLATNTSFLQQLEGFDIARSRELGKARSATGRAATFQAIANVAQSFRKS